MPVSSALYSTTCVAEGVLSYILRHRDQVAFVTVPMCTGPLPVAVLIVKALEQKNAWGARSAPLENIVTDFSGSDRNWLAEAPISLSKIEIG